MNLMGSDFRSGGEEYGDGAKTLRSGSCICGGGGGRKKCENISDFPQTAELMKT